MVTPRASVTVRVLPLATTLRLQPYAHAPKINNDPCLYGDEPPKLPNGRLRQPQRSYQESGRAQGSAEPHFTATWLLLLSVWLARQENKYLFV
ncbi:hypothetical protein B0H16DRAFT_1562995 [Mycena metata]|uniref:Uncharacterized protein n=1 Tax=Mycena metata TaxID=1033252 RepID=A0AAD7N1P4_9AGAR|nr:hypothetical protein B0H16DRAFT_1562995 [Mycena metata]